MYLPGRLLLPIALALTIVPGLRTIAKATPTSKPPTPLPTPLPAPAAIAMPLSLPHCARSSQKKLLDELKCKPNDSTCICNPKKQFLARLLAMSAMNCGKSDQKAVKDFAAVFCGKDPTKITGPVGKGSARSATSSSKSDKKAKSGSEKGKKESSTSSTRGKSKASTKSSTSTSITTSAATKVQGLLTGSGGKCPVEKPKKTKAGAIAKDAKKAKPKVTKTHIAIPAKHNASSTMTYECSPLSPFGSQRKVGNKTVNGTIGGKKHGNGTAGKNGPVGGNGTVGANKTGGMIGGAGSGRMENPLGGGLSTFGLVVLVGSVFVMQSIFGEV